MTYQAEKHCCSICDRQKVCHVCGKQTLIACSDCRLNFGAVVYVCPTTACRDAHESKCFGDGSGWKSDLDRWEAYKKASQANRGTVK